MKKQLNLDRNQYVSQKIDIEHKWGKKMITKLHKTVDECVPKKVESNEKKAIN